MKRFVNGLTSITIVMVLALLLVSVSCITINMPSDEDQQKPAATEDQTTPADTPAVSLPDQQADATPSADNPPPFPVVGAFSVSPDIMEAGESSTLSWSVEDATTVAINQGIGNVALSGSRTVSPAATTTYTLTATNASGSSYASTQVVVTSTPAADLPVIHSFVADPEIVFTGNSSILSWSVSNATSIEISPGIGEVDAAGSATVTPGTTTSYTLLASNAAGWRSQTITVSVTSIMFKPPVVLVPMFYSDLVVEYLKFEDAKLKYRIKNQGTGNAGAFKTVLTIDGTIEDTRSISGLNAGTSTSEYSISFLCFSPKTVIVTADSGGAISESDETNNKLKKIFCD